jgi:hypothetical protein
MAAYRCSPGDPRDWTKQGEDPEDLLGETIKPKRDDQKPTKRPAKGERFAKRLYETDA